MPWQDHKSEWKRKKEIESPTSCVSRDDSFINEHLIPKKANDDRRHSNGKDLESFRSRTKIGLPKLKLNSRI